jgi:hypothetical protein
MMRLTKNCNPSVVTSAFSKGGVGDSAAIETPSIVGEDKVLINADSPWDAFRGAVYAVSISQAH